MSEKFLLRGFVAAIVVMTVTGIINHWQLTSPVTGQILSLIHLISGILSSGVALYYGYLHSKMTLAFRRITSIILGCLAFFAFIVALGTGLALAVYGVTKSNSWLLTLHHGASYSSVAGIILHVLIHWLTFPKRRSAQLRAQGGSQFKTLDSSIAKPIILISGIAFIIGLGIAQLDHLLSVPPQPDPVANYSYNYANNADIDHFLPAMATTQHNAFIPESAIAQSMQCIACHQTIGEQWLASAHRHAADDPTYTRNINLLEKKKGIEAARYCEGCHAPIALLTGQLSAGGKHAGVKGTSANHEGISCMSCHGVNQVHSTQGNASYHFKPRTDYLFEHANHELLKKLNFLTIKLRPETHSNDLLAPVQQTAEFCSACHSQFMDESMNEWGWVKMQDEYLAWSNSKFNQSSDTRFSHPHSKNCQACHMPLVKGTGMAADSQGLIREHYFVGANMMLAKQFDNEELYQKTKNFLQQDKVSIYIVPPEDKRAQKSVLYVNPHTGVDDKHPIALYRGETSQIRVLVNNHGVGHNFPAGTIDLTEAWVQIKVLDGNGQLVFSSGELEEDGSIQSGSTVYKEVALNRHGEEVWKHDLFNMVGRSYVNVIPAGATDVIEYSMQIPDWAVSPLNLTATLKFRKLNQRYQNWVEEQQPIKANPIIDIARDSLAVTLRSVPGVN